jgi:hypothetical protein
MKRTEPILFPVKTPSAEFDDLRYPIAPTPQSNKAGIWTSPIVKTISVELSIIRIKNPVISARLKTTSPRAIQTFIA